MLPSRHPTGAPPAGARSREWPTVVLLLILAAAVRGLRFWSDLAWPSSDEVNVAVPAIQILGGTFPVHHVGVEYVGAVAAYPMAVWFALVGSSTMALDVFCYAVGLGVAWTGFLVARRLLPPPAAWLALAVLAAPPLLLARWGLNGALNPPVMLLIGNLLLLGTHTVFFRRPGRAVPLFVLGLLAGVGWWAYPLVVVYWAPFGVLALRTGLIRQARFWLFPLGVLVGGLPDWIYEVLYYPSTRLMLHGSGALPSEPIASRASQLVGDIALQLIGGSATDGFVPPAGAPVALAILAALALARAMLRDRAGLRWLVAAGGSPGRGLGMLWALVLANVGLVLLTKRTLGAAYLLPLYSVLPIWIGEWVWWLSGRRRWLGAGALAAWLAFQLWANWAVTLGRERGPVRWANLEATTRPLTEWLTARGIRHVYWAGDAGVSAFEFTYLSGQRVIAAHLWASSVVQHAHAVDADAAPPIVATASRLAELRASLRGLSLELQETPVGRFVVIEAKPTRAMAFAPIPPSGWTVTASDRSHEAFYLIDRDAGTGWSTGALQAPGQWLAVDLGREEDVARVDLLAVDWKEVPAGFHVEWSWDGEHWDEVASVPHYWGPLFWSERHAFLKVRRGRVQVIFNPVRARHLRLTLDQAGPQAWAAREVFVYRPGPASTAVSESGDLVAALRREGIHFVYASHWLSARVRQESGESIGALESNSAINSYGRSPEPSVLERFRPQPDRAILLGDDADGAEVRRALTARGALARESVAGPYPLLVLAREAPRRILARDGWRASATRAAATARQAVDGDPRTRWTADGPVDSAVSFTLELDRARRLTGLGLVPGSREGGPADFVLEGSADGQGWQPLEPRTWAGPLFWTGTELLRNSRPEWAVTFPPATVRAVRIHPAGPAPRWAIAEIEVFAAP